MEGGGCSLHLFPWVDAVTDAGASGLGAALAQGAVVHLDEGKKKFGRSDAHRNAKGMGTEGEDFEKRTCPGSLYHSSS